MAGNTKGNSNRTPKMGTPDSFYGKFHVKTPKGFDIEEHWKDVNNYLKTFPTDSGKYEYVVSNLLGDARVFTGGKNLRKTSKISLSNKFSKSFRKVFDRISKKKLVISQYKILFEN